MAHERLAGGKRPRLARVIALAALWALAARADAGAGDAAPYLLPPRGDLAPPAAAAEGAALDIPRDFASALRRGREEAEAVERWLEWVAADGSDLQALFGIPAPADRAAVELGAREALRRVQSAARLLESGIAGFDQAESGGAKPTDELAEDAARAVHARTVLLPLRAARAMLLAAAVESDTARREKLGEVAAKTAAGAEPVSPWADGERSLLMGLGGLIGTPESAEAARAALDDLAAAKRTITDADAPRGLAAELGDEVALATVLAVTRVNSPGAPDPARLLDRALEQPGMADSALARGAAAGLRLRVLSGQAGGARALPAEPTEAGLAGFAREFDRALAESPGSDALRPLERLVVLSRAGGAREEPEAAAAPRGASLGGALGAVAAALHEPAEAAVDRAAERVRSLAAGNAWRRILALALVEARPAPDAAPSRRALARAALDLLDALPEAADRRRALARARAALAPLGVPAQAEHLELVERVFTRSHHEGPDEGGRLRVGSAGSEWGLKEIHEARAAISTAACEYDAALARLELSDTLAAGASPAGRRCAECWWGLMDAMLRDPEVVESRREQVERAAAGAERGVQDWVPLVPDVGDAGPGADSASEAARAHAEVERRMRPIATDVLLTRGRMDEADGVLRLPRGAPGKAESILVRWGAGRTLVDEDLSAGEVLGMPSAVRGEWTRRVIARAWAKVRPLTRGFVVEASAVPEAGAAVRAATGAMMLRAFLPDIPEAARPAALECVAWCALIVARDQSGAVHAAERFAEAMTASGRRADLMLGRAEALLLAGDDAGAFAAFRDVAAAVPAGSGAGGGDGGASSAPRAYFHAWARMLEVLARQNADGSKSGTIQRESRRLMLLGPARVCPECAAKIEAAGASPR